MLINPLLTRLRKIRLEAWLMIFAYAIVLSALPTTIRFTPCGTEHDRILRKQTMTNSDRLDRLDRIEALVESNAIASIMKPIASK